MNKLVQLGIDVYKGNIPTTYEGVTSNEVFRKALIEANKGSDKITTRGIRDGKYNGLFAVIEEAITSITVGGIAEDNPLFNYVEFRNLNEGDSAKFIIQDEVVVSVSEVANGVNNLRRQRYLGGEEIEVATRLYGAATYEDVKRLLAGKVTWTDFVDAISKSFKRKLNDSVYAAIAAAIGGAQGVYKVTGTFSEDKLNSIIDHVEAENPGKVALIIGATQATRKITNIRGADSNSAKEELFKNGVFQSYGRNIIISMANTHKYGTDEFALATNELYVVAADEKFIKVVHEGETYMTTKDPYESKSFQQEVAVFQNWGIATVMTSKAGFYALQ